MTRSAPSLLASLGVAFCTLVYPFSELCDGDVVGFVRGLLGL